MKTITQKLVGATAVALFTISLNAQNVKSVNVGYFKEEFAGLISEKVEPTMTEFTAHLENLKSFVKFAPEVIKSNNYSEETSFDATLILSELEADVKFNPSAMSGFENEYSGNVNDLKDVLSEIESIVRYNPAVSRADSNADFDEVLEGISTFVKYKPVINNN